MTRTGRLLDKILVPGSPEWLYDRFSSSRIAAVSGTSPYESRFSLWHRMAGNASGQAVNEQMMIGHYFEPAVAQWFSDQHPEWGITRTGTWEHRVRTWQIASPDRMLHQPDPGWEPETVDDGVIDVPVLNENSSILECKFSQYEDGWDDDNVTLDYYDQVQWQLDTLGLDHAYVAVYFGISMKFREYRIEYNPRRAAELRELALAFMDSLPNGTNPQPPNVDSHTETYVVLRELNPDIDGDITLPDEIAEQYRAAKDGMRAAKEAEQLAVNTIAQQMGTAKRAFDTNGVLVATRQAGRNGAPPFVKAPAQTKANRKAA